MNDEQPLVGNVTTGVVRVGDTVRRPVGPWTDTVDALLTHLRDVGFTGAPRPLGRDARGRQVLEYVAGEVGADSGAYPDPDLAVIGRTLAEFHDAVASFTPPAGAMWNAVIPPDEEDLVCHNDAAPWNLVRAERGWVLIDWDGAGPASRVWELAYSAQSMAGLNAFREPRDSARRLRVFVDGYGADARLRERLAGMLARRAHAMYDLLRTGAREGRQPWARIWVSDGGYWRDTAEYLDTHVDLWSAALA